MQVEFPPTDGISDLLCFILLLPLFSVERLLKRFLMIIGIFTVMYVITYHYHFMTVNIVSDDVSHIQGKTANLYIDVKTFNIQ